MIQVGTLQSRILSALDAEGFDRYRFEEDIKPAINYAKDWIVSVFTKLYADNKLSEEHLREITKVNVYITSKYSRITLGENVWTVLGIYPEIKYSGVLAPIGNGELSVLSPNAKYIESDYSASKSTAEKFNQNKKNPFASGNSVITCHETKTYAYVGYISGDGILELTINPKLIQKPVAVKVVSYPNDIVLESDTLPFPKSLTNIMTTKSLEWISWKQGDSTNLQGVTEQELRELIQILG